MREKKQRVSSGKLLLFLSLALAAGACNQAPVVEPCGSYTVTEGQTFQLEAKYTDDGEKANVTWHFGDGAKAYGKTVSHAYTAPGEYQIEVIVMDEGYKIGRSYCQAKVTSRCLPPLDEKLARALEKLAPLFLLSYHETGTLLGAKVESVDNQCKEIKARLALDWRPAGAARHRTVLGVEIVMRYDRLEVYAPLLEQSPGIIPAAPDSPFLMYTDTEEVLKFIKQQEEIKNNRQRLAAADRFAAAWSDFFKALLPPK